MTALAELHSFSGPLLQPGDPGYDEARRIHNGMIDKRPALIARCRDAADVAAALELARERGFEVSVRGGGHNVAGTAVTDGGVMIDLSLMRSVEVDAAARRARVGGGATWGLLDRAAQRHGLAVTGGMISSTGVAGLTLGGGLGWLMGRHGLAVDNLASVEIVTADGRVLTAGEHNEPDLFWAVRGGGGNFGVVTRFDFRLHSVGPMVLGGYVFHPVRAAAEVLRFYRDFTADGPVELTLNAALTHAPDGSGVALAAIVGCHVGAPEQAARELQPLLDFGSPLERRIGPVDYTAMNSLLDPGYPRGALNYWKSSFLERLSDEAIETMVELFASCPSRTSSFVIEHLHGEATRVPVQATAVPHRRPGYNFLITSVWHDPGSNDENIAWTRSSYDAMRPFMEDRRYVNYIAADELGDDPVREAYGVNYARLVALKAVYDPDNVFHLNQNIRPGPRD